MPKRNDEDGDQLPDELKRRNVMLAIGHPFINPFTMSAVIQFAINCIRASKDKKVRLPVLLKFENTLSGESCAEINQKLLDSGVSTEIWSLGPYHITDKTLFLSCTLLVPATQAWMADVALRWSAGGTYVVSSPPVSGRAGNPPSDVYAKKTRPWKKWGVTAKPRSWFMALLTVMYKSMDEKRVDKNIQKKIDKMQSRGKPKKGREK